MKAPVFFLLFAFAATTCAQPAKEAAARAALFRYNRNSPVAVKEISAEKRNDVTVRDITFPAGPGAREVKAYLVVPAGNGPFAGILWVHWLGEEKSNRTATTWISTNR